MDMKTWEPQLGDELLREIGDVNDVDRCPYIARVGATFPEWRRHMHDVSLLNRSSWWLQLQPHDTQPVDARIMTHILQAGYDGRHLNTNQLIDLVRLAVLFDDALLAAFTVGVWKVSRPEYPPSIWRDVFRCADFRTIAASDGIHATGTAAHIWRRLQTVRRLNQMVGDTFSLGLRFLDFDELYFSDEYFLIDIPLYRVVDANYSHIRHELNLAHVHEIRESARHVLHIKQTLHELAVGHDPALSKQRRAFRGPARGGTTLWMVPALVDIVLAYDSEQSECELDCAKRTLAATADYAAAPPSKPTSKRKRE